MAFSLDQKQKVLQLYNEIKFVTKVVARLGYPTRRCLYHWLWERNAPLKAPKKCEKDSSIPLIIHSTHQYKPN